MADAIEAVRPSLKNFYASLSDDQKARFNTMHPSPREAAVQRDERFDRGRSVSC
jgi:hypothetical protein